MREPKTYTHMEWMGEAERLFGPDALLWRFECPICHHTQCPEDFSKYQERGATIASSYLECIGRYLPKGECRYDLGMKGPKDAPCDFATWGNSKFGDEVTDDKGKKTIVFPFAKVEPEESN